METITIKCEKCKSRINVKSETGVQFCPICECKNEVIIFPENYTIDQIKKSNEVFKDLKKVIKKNELDHMDDNIKLMEITISFVNSI